MSDTNRRRVTASELSDMGFCEMKCYLKAHLGEVDTAASIDAKRAGQVEHARFHVEVTEQHNRSRSEGQGAKTDKRCFIASAVYGELDPRTDQLRQFRDRALLPNRAGRLLVSLYYFVSPSIADTLSRHLWLRHGTRRILDQLRRRIASSTSKEAQHERYRRTKTNCA